MRHTILLLLTITSLCATNVGGQEKTRFSYVPCAMEDAGCSRAVEWGVSNDAKKYAGVRGNSEKSRQFLVLLSSITGVGENKAEYRQTNRVSGGQRSSLWQKRGYKKCPSYGQTALCPLAWETTAQPAVGDLYIKSLPQLRELENTESLFKGVAVNN